MLYTESRGRLGKMEGTCGLSRPGHERIRDTPGAAPPSFCVRSRYVSKESDKERCLLFLGIFSKVFTTIGQCLIHYASLKRHRSNQQESPKLAIYREKARDAVFWSGSCALSFPISGQSRKNPQERLLRKTDFFVGRIRFPKVKITSGTYLGAETKIKKRSCLTFPVIITQWVRAKSRNEVFWAWRVSYLFKTNLTVLTALEVA